MKQPIYVAGHQQVNLVNILQSKLARICRKCSTSDGIVAHTLKRALKFCAH